jgi:hypothetical protein
MHLNDRPFVPASEPGREADKSCNQESRTSTRKDWRKCLNFVLVIVYAGGMLRR